MKEAAEVVGGVVAGVGLVYGATFSLIFGTMELRKLKDGDLGIPHKQETVRIAQGRYESAQQGVRRAGVELDTEVGKKCLSLIKAYSPGGVLYDGDVGATVDSIVASPSRSCGTDSVQVGHEVAHYQYALSVRSQQYNRLEASSSDLQDTIANKWTTAWVAGEAAKGAAVMDGVLLGCVAFVAL